MANFLDLPPEIRTKIYNALLIDPINNKDKIMFTMDKDEHSHWNHITEMLPPDDELATDTAPEPLMSSIKHLDYSDLWSLAQASRLMYAETTPVIYTNAHLEYTSGEHRDGIRGPTLLHEFLDNFPSASCVFCRNLTIINNHTSGTSISAKDMNVLVDLINTKLPNLRFLELRAIDPELDIWHNDQNTGFVTAALQIMAAARPIARLTSHPKVTLKTKISFWLADSETYDPELTLIMTVLEGLMVMEVVPSLLDIRNWRRDARIRHAKTCQQGDYLQLTSGLRSEMVGDEQTTGVEEEEDSVEAELVGHGKILKRIENCKWWRMLLDGQLRKKSG